MVAGAVGFALIAPGTYDGLTQEDGLVEWSTFVAFLFASGLFLAAARPQTSAPWARLFLLGLAAFCFFVAGEEISWAQRLFGFRPPEVFLEHNYQQESNLHNLLKGLLDTRWIVLAIALSYGVIWPVVAKRLQGDLQHLAPSIHLLPGFASVVLLEAFYPFHLSGEVAELILGLCFLAEALRRRPIVSSGWIPALQAGCFAAGLAIIPVTDRIIYGDAEQAAERTRSELELLAEALSGSEVARGRLFKKRRVHKRMFTAVRARYFKLEQETLDEWGYFLDAWNQPIWIDARRVERGRVEAVLYSFGPNRRRDGDDIRVSFELMRAPRVSSAR